MNLYHTVEEEISNVERNDGQFLELHTIYTGRQLKLLNFEILFIGAARQYNEVMPEI